mmetsp:Transcript_89444/g.283082  ORF Transcript_89444/g.283082 Transcript_89444/m.283082 type:complete len:299 (+) Transcript_89444:61-957(+)
MRRAGVRRLADGGRRDRRTVVQRCWPFAAGRAVWVRSPAWTRRSRQRGCARLQRCFRRQPPLAAWRARARQRLRWLARGRPWPALRRGPFWRLHGRVPRAPPLPAAGGRGTRLDLGGAGRGRAAPACLWPQGGRYARLQSRAHEARPGALQADGELPLGVPPPRAPAAPGPAAGADLLVKRRAVLPRPRGPGGREALLRRCPAVGPRERQGPVPAGLRVPLPGHSPAASDPGSRHGCGARPREQACEAAVASGPAGPGPAREVATGDVPEGVLGPRKRFRGHPGAPRGCRRAQRWHRG